MRRVLVGITTAVCGASSLQLLVSTWNRFRFASSAVDAYIHALGSWDLQLIEALEDTLHCHEAVVR